MRKSVPSDRPRIRAFNVQSAWYGEPKLMSGHVHLSEGTRGPANPEGRGCENIGGRTIPSGDLACKDEVQVELKPELHVGEVVQSARTPR